jgi:hypothetical protein
MSLQPTFAANLQFAINLQLQLKNTAQDWFGHCPWNRRHNRHDVLLTAKTALR